MDDPETWIGRTEERRDVAAAGSLRRLAALLDHDDPPWRPDEVPPLGHWLFFLPEARQSALGPDGHPLGGGLIPQSPLPRRMWAGSRIAFHAPVALGAPLLRRSTVQAVRRAEGRSGPLVFVTLRHEIEDGGGPVITEEQELVYRAAASGPPPPPRAPSPGGFDAARLFCFSALTFNSHRIHYDRDHAVGVENYPGLVVQGPYLAILLMDDYLRAHPGAGIAAFEFEARRALFEGDAFLPERDDAPGGARLRAMAPDGAAALTAKLRRI
jgi:3-methylfumaryl-CoA hydratase